MATTKFYLTRPYESKSGIYAGIPRKEKNRDGKIRYYKLKYYIPLSIETKYWNTKTHQTRDNARFQSSTSFNENLKNYGDTIQGLLLKLKKDRIILSDAELKKRVG